MSCAKSSADNRDGDGGLESVVDRVAGLSPMREPKRPDGTETPVTRDPATLKGSQLLLTQITQSGYMPSPADGFAIECRVYTDKLVITHRFGSGATSYSVTESRQVEFGGDIGKLLKDAAAAELQKQDDSSMVDAGTLSILGGSDKFVLFSFDGFNQRRSGEAASFLIRMSTTLCPHDGTADYMWL